MKYRDDIRYILSDEVRFRKESHRCLFYTVDDFFYAPDNVSVIHPQDVIFLLLFDGTRSFADVKRDFEFLFDNAELDVEQALSLLGPQLHDYEFLVPVKKYDEAKIEKIRNRFNPEDYLIPSDQVFLDPRNLRLEAPLSVNFNVSTRCGFSCRYCYHPLVPVDDYISLDRLDVLFSDLKKAGVESVLLTGGDPMLRPDIDDVMELIHKHGVFYTLSTKSVLSNERIKKLYDRAGLDRIQISLDSFDDEVEQKLIGVGPGYVDKIVNMIKYMQSIDMDVRIKAVLTSINAGCISDYLDKCVELGIKHIQVVGYGRSGYRHDDELFATQEQLDSVSSVIETWRKEHADVDLVGGGYQITYSEHKRTDCVDFKEMMKDRVICNAGRFSLLIMPNGEAFICEHLPYDPRYVLEDFRTQDLYEVWNGKKMKAWLSAPDRNIFHDGCACKTCPDEYYKYCHEIYSRCLRFCREYLGDVYEPDYKCPMAEYGPIRIL